MTFGFNGTYTPGAHGLVEPFLTEFSVADDPNDAFGFDFGDDEPLVYLLEAPEGSDRPAVQAGRRVHRPVGP